jgi:hypothetical protein
MGPLVRCMPRWLIQTLRNTSYGPPQDDGGTR